jgi:hypothetical protein
MSAALIALITELVAVTPELIKDIEMLINDLKSKPAPTTTASADVHAATDALEAKLEGK